MWINKEIPLSLAAMAVLTVCSCLLYSRSPQYGGILIAGNALVSAGLYTGCTVYRYSRIHKLSAYLKRLQQELADIEVWDHREGELGVLKSELYKIVGKMRSQAELLEKDKNYLAGAVSDISHQLKTPLTSMNVMVDLLSDSNLPPDKRREFTDGLHKQLMRIEWLVTSLLTMSKMDAGQIAFKQEPVNVTEMIKKASEHLLIPMELKEQEFIVRGDGQAAYTGDLQWSCEAAANILKNCMEHTQKGGRITAECAENALYTEIKITDNGEGIHEKDIPHIFERFYKGNNSSPTAAGIGLALAKQIIGEQNGMIEVESRVKKYTCFKIRFYKK